MVRKIIVVAVVLAIGSSAAAGVIGPVHYPALHGLTGISARAITRDAGDVIPHPRFEQSLREQLTAAGIRLLPYDNDLPGRPELILWVAPDSMELDLSQEVWLVRSPSVKVRATTWRSLRARPNRDYQQLVPDSLVREFVEAWRETNAVGPTR